MQRAAITAIVFAVLSALVSLAMAGEWIRSYRFGEIVERSRRWEGTGEDGERLYYFRTYFAASSRGAIRVRYASGVSSNPPGFRPRPPATQPTTFPVRAGPPRRRTPPPAYRLPNASGWFRDVPVTESFGRDQTPLQRMMGFDFVSYDWARNNSHDEGWLLAFPHWAMIVLFALYPAWKLFAWVRQRRRKSKAPAPPAV